MIVVGASLNEWTTHFGKILENGKKIIQIDDREDAVGWFARPRKRVTHVTADASFIMNVVDFHTAVSHNLALTVFVFNDNAVGQERHDLVHKGFPTKYAEVAQPDFEKLAVGFGAKGFRVDRPDDFGEIDKALAIENGPVIVNVHINGDVELPVSWEIAQHLENTGE